MSSHKEAQSKAYLDLFQLEIETVQVKLRELAKGEDKADLEEDLTYMRDATEKAKTELIQGSDLVRDILSRVLTGEATEEDAQRIAFRNAATQSNIIVMGSQTSLPKFEHKLESVMAAAIATSPKYNSDALEEISVCQECPVVNFAILTRKERLSEEVLSKMKQSPLASTRIFAGHYDSIRNTLEELRANIAELDLSEAA